MSNELAIEHVRKCKQEIREFAHGQVGSMNHRERLAFFRSMQIEAYKALNRLLKEEKSNDT